MKKFQAYQLADHDKFFNVVTGYEHIEDFPEAGYYVLSEPFETRQGDETAVVLVQQAEGYLKLDAAVRVGNEIKYDPIWELDTNMTPKELLEELGHEVFTC